MPKKYSDEFCTNAIRMVLDRQAAEGGAKIDSIRTVADSLGVATETLRMWVSRHQPPSTTPEDPVAEVKRLRRENAELRRANDLLKKASAFFAAELDRPDAK